MRIVCGLSTEVKIHLFKEACMIKHEHDRKKTGETQDEEKNLIFVVGQEVEF